MTKKEPKSEARVLEFDWHDYNNNNNNNNILL